MEQFQELSFAQLPIGIAPDRQSLGPFLIRKKNLHGISSLPNAVAPVASNLDALEESLHPDVLGIDSEIFILALSAQGHLL